MFSIARNAMRFTIMATCALAAACGESAVDPGTADVVYLNGKIYTADTDMEWAEAVAIKDGRFVVVGSSSEARAVSGEQTRVVDLEGQFVMPGIIDLHSHPFITPWYGPMNLKLENPGNQDEMLREIAAYAAANPEKEWIIGGQYLLGVFPSDKPRKELLDAVVPDRPVAILDQTGHSMWLNSKALEVAGIDADTPTNALVVIDKDAETGEPTGTIYEQALQLVERQVPQADAETYADMVESIFDMFVSYGITSQQTAEGHRAPMDGLSLLESQGRLHQRVFVSWDWKTTLNLAYSVADIESQIRNRAKYESDLVYPDYVKIFADGSPISKTSILIEPYSNDPQSHGSANMTTEEFAEAFGMFDEWGVGVHVHAMGDGTIRRVVDAFELMKSERGDSGVRHKIAHNTMISTADLERVAALRDVNIDFSPPLWQPHPARGAFEPAVGADRYEMIYPVKTALSMNGLHVGQGADWQTANPTPNPFIHIEGLVTRRHPTDPATYPGALNPDEAVDLAQAIAICTIEGAYVLGVEDELGSIETGKWADMIILDRNLFEIEADAIDQTLVLKTLIAGEVAYDRTKQGDEDVEAQDMLDRM